MKYFVLHLAGLVSVLIVALLVNDAIWFKLLTTSTGSSAAKIYRICGHHPAEEIPIFGSSRAQTGFDPDVFGPNCFNYGISGSRQNETFDLIEIYLQSADAGVGLPIIINIDPWGFPPDGNAGLWGDYGLVDGSLIGCRSFGKLREVFTTWLNERMGGTKTIRRGAELLHGSRTLEEWAVINAKLKPMRFFVSDYWKSRIEQMSAKTLRPIYWVVGPCASRWKDLFEGSRELDEFCSWLARVPRQKVFNLYAQPYGDGLFADPTHLNISGAKDLSLRIWQGVVEIVGLSD